MNKFRVLVGVLVFCAGLGWGTDFIWIGAIDTDWNNPGNWNGGPTDYPGFDGTTLTTNDNVEINIPSPPQLSTDITLGSLTIDNPGALDLNGKYLKVNSFKVTGDVNLGTSGTLQAANSVIVTGIGVYVTGTAKFGDTSAGSLDISNSAITISGSDVIVGSGDVILNTEGIVNINTSIERDGGTIRLTGTSINLNDDLTTGITGGVELTATATTGAITQASTKKIKSADLQVTAHNNIALDGSNTVNVFEADSTNGAVSFTNDVSGFMSTTLTINGVSGGANDDITIIENGGNIKITDEIEAGDNVTITTSGTIDAEGTGALITSSNGLITLTANDIRLKTGTTTVDAGSGQVTILNKNDDIYLGGTGTDLSLTSAELTNILTSILEIGAETGNITINNSVTLTTVNDLILRSSGSITQQTSGVITAKNLEVEAGGAVNLGLETNSIGSLAVTAGGAVQFTNGKTLSIGISGAGTTPGISAAGHPVTVETTVGDIRILKAVNGGTVSLTAAGGIIQPPSEPATAIITGTVLTLESGGEITLTKGNAVSSLAVTGAGGAVQFTNAQALEIGGSGTGIVSAGNVNVETTAGSITVSDAVDAGTGTKTVSLTSAGNITQPSTAAIITGTVLTLESGGEITLTKGNEVSSLVVTNAAGAVQFTNAQALEIGGSGAGIVSADNVTVETTAGSITVSDAIDAGTAAGDVYLKAAAGFVLDGGIVGKTVILEKSGNAGEITQNTGGIISAGTLFEIKNPASPFNDPIVMTHPNNVAAFAAEDAGVDISFFNDRSSGLTVNTVKGNARVEIKEVSGSLKVTGPIIAEELELGAKGNITIDKTPGFSHPDLVSPPKKITFAQDGSLDRDSASVNPLENIKAEETITIRPYYYDTLAPPSLLDIAINDTGGSSPLSISQELMDTLEAPKVIIGDKDACGGNIYVGNNTPPGLDLTVGGYNFFMQTKGEVIISNRVKIDENKELHIVADGLRLKDGAEIISQDPGDLTTIILEINGFETGANNKIDAGDGTIKIYPVMGQTPKPIQFGETDIPGIMPSPAPGNYFYYSSEWNVLRARSYIIGISGYNAGIYISGVSNATYELTVINDNNIYFFGSYNSVNESLKLTTNEIHFLNTAHINIGTADLTLEKKLYLTPYNLSQTVIAASITASGKIIITNQISGYSGTDNSLTITNGTGKTWIGGDVDLSGDFTYTGSSITFVAIPSPGTPPVPTPPPETALYPSDPPVELKAGGQIKFDTPRIDGNIIINGYITASGQDIPFYGNLTFAGPVDAAKNIANSAWLVFSGDREQRFDSGGSVNPMGNIRIEKDDGAKVLAVGNDVIQRDGAELYIKTGLLNLTETVPPTEPLKTWTMGIPSEPAEPGTFTGIRGKLSLGDDSGTGAGLKAVDVDFQGPLGLSGVGIKNTITATGNFTAAKDTAGSAVKDFEKIPVVMFPDGTAEEKKISSQVELGTLIILRPALANQNLNLRNMQLGALGYTEPGSTAPADYKTGVYLNAASPGVSALTKITVHGNWTNHVIDVNNSTDNITTAFRGISEVVFDSAVNPDKVVKIAGNSAWYAFTCVSPGVTIKFDNYPKRHYISGRFTLNGGVNVEDYIILTRLDDVPGEPACKLGTIKPVLPLTEEEHKKFWDFVVAPKTAATQGTVMNLSNLVIMFSNASLRLAIPPEDRHVWAYPYFSPNDPYNSANPGFVYTPGTDGGQYSYYNINWILQHSFIYAYTEDANGNGRIDRIRAQAAFELNAFAAGAFEGLEMKVKIDEAAEEEWIPVTGYGPVPNSPESIYIYLEEHEYADGGAENLFVSIENNETLVDLATGLNPIQGNVLTIDTVFPRISYALMLPGSNKAFVQFSEKIDDSVIEFTYPPYPSLGREQIVPVDGKKNEFELSFPAGSVYDVKTLASGLEFTVKGVRDNAKWAVDRNMADPDMPSPRYPKDVKYSDYVTVPGNPEEWTLPPTVTVLYPPNGLPVPGGFPNGELPHRITDMLVSLPPTGAQPPANDPFFVWPVWAINPQEKDNITEQRQDIHVVRKFAGRDYLEDKDITLEVNMNEAFVGTHTPRLVFRAAVPDAVRAGSGPVDPSFGVPHGNDGLWLGDFESRTYPNNERPDLPAMPESPYGFSNLVPRPCESAYTRSADSESSNGRVFDFKLLKTAASEYAYGVSTLEFFLRLSPRNNPYTNPSDDPSEYLYIGQLGEGAKPWYRRVAPFKLEIHNITRQRSGVTILNNVIKPSTGEKVYLDYRLSRNGPVTIQVFTLDGTLVKVLVRENKTSGEYRTDWDGKNNGGREVARGMYFIRVVAPDIDEIRKVMVVK